jgi:hypothetical protein
VGTAPAGSTSYTETGLIPGTVYNRQVVAYTDAGGNGPRSAVMSQATAADILAPIAHAPTPQERRTSDNTPIWTWPASSDASGILRYEIQQKAASASWPDEWIIVGQNTF